jgi:hypothetical protein
MNGYDYLCQRQREWARRWGVDLDPARPVESLRQYARTLPDNLFRPLHADTLADFVQADGNELKDKMRALHSSSAVCVNVFDYWRWHGDARPIVKAAKLSIRGLAGMAFEQKLPIDPSFSRAPNLDLLLTYDLRTNPQLEAVGVESKFGEPYGGSHGGLDPKYLKPTLWKGLPHCHTLAGQISPKDTTFKRLHAAQLLKHLLGMRRRFGQRFILLYLWTDAPVAAADKHRQEIADFRDILKRDRIDFRSLTYQELLFSLLKNTPAGHHNYCRYVADRYL